MSIILYWSITCECSERFRFSAENLNFNAKRVVYNRVYNESLSYIRAEMKMYNLDVTISYSQVYSYSICRNRVSGTARKI